MSLQLMTRLRSAADRASLVGAVVPYAGASAPYGWLFCYGQNVSRTTYAALFAILGTTYGAGNGSTTFGLPDLRGRVPFGLDNMGGSAASRLTGAQTGGINANALGNTGGEQGHTQTTTELTSHLHNASGAAGGGAQVNWAQTSTAVNTGRGNSTDSQGGGGAHNTVPPGIALNYMIFCGV